MTNTTIHDNSPASCLIMLTQAEVHVFVLSLSFPLSYPYHGVFVCHTVLRLHCAFAYYVLSKRVERLSGT
jgi:hypothetical protein